MNTIFEHFQHLFIPRHTNNFRAKLLHHDFLTIYLVFALTLTVGLTYIKNHSGDVLGFATDISTTKLFELTNAERVNNNLPPLKYNNKLSAAAQKKAEDMFAKDYWAHYGPSGETPWEFILGAGYQYEFAGENLAKNFLFSDGVVNAWMQSPTHRENMLRKEYTDVGYAIVNGVLNGEETTLVVQMFGKPLYPVADELSQDTPVDTVPADMQVQATQPVVLAKDAQQSKNFFAHYFNLNIIFFSILIAALLMDFYFAAKLNLISVKGKNLIHMLFLLFIAVGAFIIIRGSIV